MTSKVKRSKVNGEQCMGKCISRNGFSMTVVFSGKLQHKVSYLVNSGGGGGGVRCVWTPSHKFHQFWTPGTSYPHYSLGSLFNAVVSPKAPQSLRNCLY